MAQGTLTMDVRKAGERAAVVDIKGEITAASEEALTEAFGEASGQALKAVVFNFTDLDYMNSGGIGLLVTLLVRANRQKQKLMAIGLNEHYRQIFELTRLDDAIAIPDTEQDALAAAGVR